MAVTLTMAKSKYYYYSNQVDSYNKTIIELDEQYDEIRQLKSRFDSTQSSFHSSQQKLLSKFHSSFGGVYQIRVMKAYQNGMSDLLTGIDYQKASSGLETAISIIENKRKELLSKIEQYEGLRQTAINNRNYWAEIIRTLQVEEAGG